MAGSNPYLYGAILYSLWDSVRFDVQKGRPFKPVSDLYAFLREKAVPIGASDNEMFEAVNVLGYNGCFQVVLEGIAGHCVLLNRKNINRLFKKESKFGRIINYMLVSKKEFLESRVSTLNRAFERLYGAKGARMRYQASYPELDENAFAAALLGKLGTPVADLGVISPEVGESAFGVVGHPKPSKGNQAVGWAALAVFLISAFATGAVQALAAKLVDVLTSIVVGS